MGNLRAVEMIQFAGEDAALRDHLQFNHFPPVNLAWLPLARAAIAAFVECDTQRAIVTPWSQRYMTAQEIMQGLHLEPFVDAALAKAGAVD